MPNIVKNFIALNREISRRVEKLLPQAHLEITDFYDIVVAGFINRKSNQIIVDIGGGKETSFAKYKNPKLNNKIIAVDLDEDEIKYNRDADEKIIADVSKDLPFKDNSVDLIVSRYVLEHIEDVDKFIKNSQRALKPGGYSINLFSSGNAPFAILNRILPHSFSQKILSLFLPGSEEIRGFRIYYNLTYKKAKNLYRGHGFQIENIKLSYYQSRYFAFFIPLYLISVVFEIILMTLHLKNLSSYILIVARKIN